MVCNVHVNAKPNNKKESERPGEYTKTFSLKENVALELHSMKFNSSHQTIIHNK